jgi:nucleotidyltransferase/DNA polymerase involved in DNA repair
VAKIASDINKPDGITICPFGEEQEFLADMPVSKLWGAGPETVKILKSAGFFTIGDIAGGDPRVFEGRLGKMGSRLWELANGIDPRPVTRCDSIKSVSEEHTFQRDTADESILSNELRNLSFRVSERSRNAGVKGRTVSIKIRLEGFETYTRSVTLQRQVNDTITIYQTAFSLYNLFERAGKKVRLIGVKLSNLLEASQDEPLQMELFNESSSSGAAIIKQEKIEEVIDSVNIRCRNSLTRASFMKKN